MTKISIQSFITIFLLMSAIAVGAQPKPQISIGFSKLLATYDFVQKLSRNYPPNQYKQLFESSKYNNAQYSGLIRQLDTLNLSESYAFRDYPTLQKRKVMISSLINKNLISAKSIADFKNRSFGLVPATELIAFSNIISTFETVYDTLIYLPHKTEFEEKLKELDTFTRNADLVSLFECGLIFYGAKWDNSIPLDIAVIPSVKTDGFTASAFLNNAISEVPLKFKHNQILFSVLLHEIYHIQYDEQPLPLKRNIAMWFNESTSKNSQYAFLLLNETLATALGNGYAYEKLKGNADQSDWYNDKYINLMAKKIYPVLNEYLIKKNSIDKHFIDKFIDIYDENFSEWTGELKHLMANRYILSDTTEDLGYFTKNYGFANNNYNALNVTAENLERMKSLPITKVVIISRNNQEELDCVKKSFPELKKWTYKPRNEFIFNTLLRDKTVLIVVNSTHNDFDMLWRTTFSDNKIKSMNN